MKGDDEGEEEGEEEEEEEGGRRKSISKMPELPSVFSSMKCIGR